MKSLQVASLTLLAVIAWPVVAPVGVTGGRLLAGSWEMVNENSRTEEHWTEVAGARWWG